MTLPILAVFLSKFFTFSVLGLMFFRKAKHNVMWVLSALPFAVNSGLLVIYYVSPDGLPAITALPHYEYMRTFALVLCVSSIALYTFTLGTHRIALPGWHQVNDAPSELVTWGPYAFVRHPFYSSYILYFIASGLLAPAWPVLLNAAFLFAVITLTAKREESELLALFGDEYTRYCKRTGRFLPRFAAEHA
jgi:protein-S-isoprenylcysteine O-methyltransferase Ste14